MKKIILILFLFFLLFICYYIYNKTEKKGLYVLSIGDNIADNINLLNNKNINKYNHDFIDKDYRIIDLLNVIQYNEEIEKNDKNISIHQLLKKADVVILSIGMNDIYYKLDKDTKEIYTYLNTMLNNYHELLKEINRYDYKKVYILGYYNITASNNDIFTYANYKLKNITKEYNYTYIDLNSIFYNNQKYYQKNDEFYLNNMGYNQIYKLIVENLKKN